MPTDTDGASPPAPAPVAIVGGGGFIGSALTARLISAGVPVRSFTRHIPFLSAPGLLSPDAASSRTVVWLASSVNPTIAQERPDLVKADHVAFVELLAAATAIEHPPCIVLISSGGTVYDPATDPPYRESSPARAVNAYGESKLRLESELRDSGLVGRVVVRVSNAYGPGQPARRGLGVIAHWLHAAAAGRRPVLIGGPDAARDYVYIDDIVRALVAIHHHDGALPEVLNIGSGVPTSLGELAKVVLDVVDDPDLAFDMRPARSFDLSRTWLDVALAERTLGWRPQTPLAEGVRATWGAMGPSRR